MPPEHTPPSANLLAAIEQAVERAVRRALGDAPREWLTADEAAELAGLNRRTLERRGCPVHRVGRVLRYRRAEVEAWLAKGAA